MSSTSARRHLRDPAASDPGATPRRIDAQAAFDAEIMICTGREIVGLTSQNHFADQPVGPDIVRFVSVLSKRPDSAPSMPMSFPSSGEWL